MTQESLLLVLAVAATITLAVIALAGLMLSVALVRVMRDVRSVARSADRALAAIEEELAPTLADLRVTGANLRRLSDELGPRLERVDTLLEEAEAAVVSLRATAEAAEDVVRGPQAAVDRARRGVRAAGEGLIRGADRLRRNVEEAAARRRES